MSKSGWQAVAEALSAEKVKLIFGIPGGPVMSLYDILYDMPKTRHVLVRHETSAVFMAMAYARLTREPGVFLGTIGPGVANFVPGILEAYAACTPLVSPCPNVSQRKEGKGAFQETDQVSMLKPITKWCYRVARSQEVPWAMRRAFSLSRNGKPGPIFVEIPADVGEEKVEMSSYVPSEYPIRSGGDPDRVEAAANLILKAERPVLVAGGGVMLSGAWNDLTGLAELLGIPVLTTPCGRGSIPENHPLAAGLVGLYRTKIGKLLYEESDLLISVGSRNEEFQSGAWTYFPTGAKFIQIDIDPFEIGRNWIPSIPIVGDAKLVLKQLTYYVQEKITERKLETMPRVAEIVKAKKEYEIEIESECLTDSVPIKTKRIVKELNRIFGANTILVNENGCQDVWSYYFPYYKVLSPAGCLAPAEQTCMGFGVAGAIGAKLTRPEKNVVCVTGDGAFQMFMKELPTAVQYHAPVTWVVLNSYSLGWIKYIQKTTFKGRFFASDFEAQPDFVKIAEANKCYGERIEKPRQIESSLRNAMKANSEDMPAVLEFIVDPWDLADGFKEFHETVRGLPKS